MTMGSIVDCCGDAVNRGARAGRHLGVCLAVCFLLAACSSRGVAVEATAPMAPVAPMALVVASTSPFEAGGPIGGPFVPATMTCIVSNPDSPTPDSPTRPWSASANVPWLVVAPSAGALPPGQQVQLVVTIDPVAAVGLGSGRHAGDITIRDVALDRTTNLAASLAVGTFITNSSWLSVHGEPFLPIAVWSAPPTANHVSYCRGLGINTYFHNGWASPAASNRQLLGLLEAEGMWAVLAFDANVIDHPRVLGWMLPDEPDLTNTPAATVQQQYDAIRAVDPDHFIALNLSGNFYWDVNFGTPTVESAYQAYCAIPDIVGFDFYPVTGFDQPTWVYMPGNMSAFLRAHYVQHGKPVWAIIESSDQRLAWTPPGTPGPSPAQMRFQVWDALIHGASAVCYFTIAFNSFEWANLTPAIEQEMMRTNGQIEALARVILSEAPAITVNTFEPMGRVHDFMVRRAGATCYVFADNADMGNQPATVTFTFPQVVSSVNVYGENRTITPVGASFTDAFAALEVHIYEVRL